jgi:hypothetical protein
MNINEAAGRLAGKLSTLNINSLDISDYSKRYLGDYLKDLRYNVQKFSYLLSWAVADGDIPLDRFVLIDYGGGTGILSFLAKELGIGVVIYNDIYDVSCRDSMTIGRTIGNEMDYCVHGDIDELLLFLKANSISCHALVSNDVIEHIYDIDGFLRKISNLSNISFNVVIASDANPLNPRIRRRVMRIQREREYTDREKTWGHKERDCLRAYLDVRKEIISHYAPELSDGEIERLGKATRGLIESDIKQCVDEYVRTKTITREPDHPTNTCDPYTGNWAEHLMDIGHLRAILSDEGFTVDIISGHYGSSSNPIKRFVGACLNTLMGAFKKHALVFAPFYVICAKKLRTRM